MTRVRFHQQQALGVVVALSLAMGACLRGEPSRPNSRAFGELRSLHSAQVAYASATGGKFGSIACLERPSSTGCIANYPPDAPVFLAAGHERPSGYDWKLITVPASGPVVERFCLQGRLREPSDVDDLSVGIDEKGTLVAFKGVSDCCGPDGAVLPICTPRE